MTPIVTFENVGKRYKLLHDRPRSFRELFARRGLSGRPVTGEGDSLWALRDVSFELQPGETVGLIGANGAGKSTALKLISRVILPDDGQVKVNGRVAALLELGTGFHPELSGRDNIFLSGALSGMGRVEMNRKFDAIVDFAELASFIDIPVKHYSSGMFARLAFAVIIHLDPEVLLVDEALAVGDLEFQRKCLGRLAEIQRSGVTICFVSHSLDSLRSLCSRAVWLEHGHLLADGPADRVVRQYQDRVNLAEAQRLAANQGLPANQRWGTGRIRITDVKLTDGQDRERHILETGEPLVVQVGFVAQDPVSSPVFGIAIHRQDGLHMCGPNTALSGLDLTTVAGAGTVKYCIPYLPFLEGLYLVSVAVHNDTETEMYDYHDRAYAFRVVNASGRVKEHYGLMTVRGEWAASAMPAIAARD